jgi:ribonuclease BN (tRNA processing enzyme)
MIRFLIAVLLLTACKDCFAQDGVSNEFTTLGTAGGPPNGNETRAQPSNLLRVGDDLYLVDVGDGTVAQLESIHTTLVTIDAVFLSHLHFDHTGGMLALLGLRLQLNAPDTLVVYGPPGTNAFIDGLHAAMAGSMEAAYGIPGQRWGSDVQVVELIQDSTVALEGLTVTVAENSHYDVPGDPEAPHQGVSLSFRFDLADRSIVYSGDTGPAPALEALARGADLLVCEMMDIEAVLADVRRFRPNLPTPAYEALEAHLRAHHVTPEQVGELAAAADVSQLVITHMAPTIMSAKGEAGYRRTIAQAFSGEIEFANDLDRF